MRSLITKFRYKKAVFQNSQSSIFFSSVLKVMPYAQSPNVKKLSKMNTLLLARNYILILRRSTEELKRVLAEFGFANTLHPVVTSHDVHAAVLSKYGSRLSSAYDKSTEIGVRVRVCGVDPPPTAPLPGISPLLQSPVRPIPLGGVENMATNVPCPCSRCLVARPMMPAPLPTSSDIRPIVAVTSAKDDKMAPKV